MNNNLMIGDNGGFSFNWIASSFISSGLYSPYYGPAPLVFEYNSDMYLILGQQLSSAIYGFKWNGAGWSSYSTIVSGLTVPSNQELAKAAVCTLNDNMYCIIGYENGSFTGFRWTGSNWVSDSSIVAGLTDVGTFSTPAILEYNSEMYLISGERYGTWRGFRWADSNWVSDSSIIAGLTDVGNYSSASIIHIENDMFLVSGEYDGVFTGFKWNGSAWAIDTDIISNLPDVGSYSKPSLFWYDSDIYLISGEYGKTINGFKLT